MGLGEPKEATPATLKEFGSKTNGTAENNECTLDDAKMASAAELRVISVRETYFDQTTQRVNGIEKERAIRTVLTETKTVVTAGAHL